MYNKLKYARMILGTILLSLMIISIFKSCSYAYTIEDFINFSEQIREQVPGFNNATNQVINEQLALYRDCEGYNFTTFIVTNANWNQSWQKTQIVFRVTPAKVTIDANNVNIQSAYQARGQWYEGWWQNGSWNIRAGTSDQRYFNSSTSYGLIELDDQEITNWQNNWFNGKYIPPQRLQFEAWVPITEDIGQFTNTKTMHNSRDVVNWRIGTLTGQTEYTTALFEKYVGHDPETDEEIFEEVENTLFFYVDSGKVYVKQANILYYQIYRVQFTDNSLPSETGEIGLYFLPYGELYRSGDPLIYGQNTNDIQPILQQQEEQQTFWQNLYNTMFVPSGDVITRNLNELKTHIGLSGDVSGELLILNNIKNNSGDFIISWR